MSEYQAKLNNGGAGRASKEAGLSESAPEMDLAADLDSFARRHIGPSAADAEAMLATIGVSSLDELVDKTVPANIRLGRSLKLPAAQGEAQALAELRRLAQKTQVWRS